MGQLARIIIAVMSITLALYFAVSHMGQRGSPDVFEPVTLPEATDDTDEDADAEEPAAPALSDERRAAIIAESNTALADLIPAVPGEWVDLTEAPLSDVIDAVETAAEESADSAAEEGNGKTSRLDSRWPSDE